MELVEARMKPMARNTRNREIINFLRELMRRRGRLRSQLSADLGLPLYRVGRWLSGEDVPSPGSCEKLADYSGVSLLKIMAMAGHLPKTGEAPADRLPEFRDYARLKYPEDLDEALVLSIEGLIERRRERRRTGHG